MARHTFFSYHYNPDVWRAWNVRNSWVGNPGTSQSVGFFDSSVFEASRRESPDALKRFLREGLEGTSVTCVLAGAGTYARRWVRYEIARSIVKGSGLLTVFIHGVKNRNGETSSKGPDPLDFMGVYKSDGQIYLCEKVDGSWQKYADYQLAIPPNVLWFSPPTSNTVVVLSSHCLAYDFVQQNGRQNIGGWIETAAGLAGR
ncbi:TIR domain-containing protein [Devosia sp. FJ2-5-3]|uniref:TIR domain-containing protein n=1 Tax=Devosia sp. FJ2-5-3 TaxID=2976680 RepID=UPI0023D823ED|nr:TIR domain-containing protein [Devosia sp. FJ2-5-3]WEJ56762.1 TIR domain-containing protein [Devosia sp. FJ2-5-3]